MFLISRFVLFHLERVFNTKLFVNLVYWSFWIWNKVRPSIRVFSKNFGFLIQSMSIWLMFFSQLGDWTRWNGPHEKFSSYDQKITLSDLHVSWHSKTFETKFQKNIFSKFFPKKSLWIWWLSQWPYTYRMREIKLKWKDYSLFIDRVSNFSYNTWNMEHVYIITNYKYKAQSTNTNMGFDGFLVWVISFS